MGIQFNINKCNKVSQFSVKKNSKELTSEAKRKLLALGYKLKEK